ncbi:MAG: hypothetical protein IKY66_07845 [Bacteroidales bacterium]|nr:hypothetical protein [Bacteroidales bacterium]
MAGRPRKFDYDGDDFYDEILALAMQGLNDAEIADALGDRFGESLSPERFNCMKNGKYEAWTKEENEKRSERICKALARGRRKITSLVRGAYLKGALGGKKVKSKTVVRRRLRVDGAYTDDEEIQTSETETEMPYNMQALATWLYNHDAEWRAATNKKREEPSEEKDAPRTLTKDEAKELWAQLDNEY